jgi:hypothetical protein
MIAKIKVSLIEFLLFAERESLAGPDYAPVSGWQKWGAQPGSVYAGGERVRVNKPRIRKEGKEVSLPIYCSAGACVILYLIFRRRSACSRKDAAIYSQFNSCDIP